MVGEEHRGSAQDEMLFGCLDAEVAHCVDAGGVVEDLQAVLGVRGTLVVEDLKGQTSGVKVGFVCAGPVRRGGVGVR